MLLCFGWFHQVCEPYLELKVKRSNFWRDFQTRKLEVNHTTSFSSSYALLFISISTRSKSKKIVTHPHLVTWPLTECWFKVHSGVEYTMYIQDCCSGLTTPLWGRHPEGPWQEVCRHLAIKKLGHPLQGRPAAAHPRHRTGAPQMLLYCAKPLESTTSESKCMRSITKPNFRV